MHSAQTVREARVTQSAWGVQEARVMKSAWVAPEVQAMHSAWSVREVQVMKSVLPPPLLQPLPAFSHPEFPVHCEHSKDLFYRSHD